MPSLRDISRLVCALCGLALVGCYSPYRQAPYNPYNPYGAGVPMYSPPGVPLQPQVIPPAGSPTPVYPNGSFPPADGSQFSPTPDPAGSFPSTNDGYTPAFDPPPNGGTGVPDAGYGDPGSLPPTGGSNTFEGNSQPFPQDGAAFQSRPANPISQVHYERAPQPPELQLAAHQTSPPAAPQVVSAFAQTTPFAGENTAAKKPNPYGYDAVAYRWLRGVVDFDEQRQSWVLIYSINPSPQDVYKGQLTLIDNGQLRKLKNNDVVLVEGQIDETTRDPGTGKPQYRVQTLHGPLVPKSPQ